MESILLNIMDDTNRTSCRLLSNAGRQLGQGQQTTAIVPFDKLPDWSGVWSMQGGTVFDRATQTGEGGAITPGVREHPPYNAEWEAIYTKNLDLRDKNLFPDVFTNCGVPAGFPRISICPTRMSSWSGLSRCGFWLRTVPNVMRIYTDGRKHLEDQWETYTGDSVGHWEGDTLVFTTIALKGSRDKRLDSRQDRFGVERQGARARAAFERSIRRRFRSR